MDVKAITDRLQGLLDELVRAEPVRDADKIQDKKAELTARITAMLKEPAPAKPAPAKPEPAPAAQRGFSTKRKD